jgi:DNA modification methylase
MTELIWAGKYDKDGKRVAPVRIALPFQTIETVNESAQDRQRTLDLFARGKPTEWRNRLIWGDKKYVLPSLLPEFAGKVDLIYIDPPFDTGADFSFTATIPDHPDTEEDESASLLKEPSIIEQKAYRDTWGKGLDSYLQWFYETVVLLRKLLRPDGSLYVHLDENVAHYAKAVLDELFVFQREIVWRIGWVSGFKSAAKNWIRNHDVILFYVMDRDAFTFNKEYVAYPEEYRRRGEEGPPADGKGYPIEDVWNANPFEFALTREDSLDSIQIKSFSAEKTGFPTQKNESLVKRIIKASSNDGDLVLDCFVGSGTTAAVAEKLGRRWIACDLSRFAIHTTRKRLLSIPGVKPFVVQNLGKYERQAWQAAEFAHAEGRAALENAYRLFILNLYHAEPVTGFNWLHGVRGGRMAHVGSVDAPVSLGDVKAIVQEFWRAVGKSPNIRTNGIDILGWEFAFELNETARQQAVEHNIDLQFKRIPREVMDKKAVEAGDIRFFELGALDVLVQASGRRTTLTLQDFIIPPDEVPEDVQRAIKHWSQWIDYWAVDWNYRDDTFHNEWQTYRARKNPKIELSATHMYEARGKYTVVVKVIDILGNDTTKSLTVEVV